MRTVLFITFNATLCGASILGSWKMDPTRSYFMGSTPPKALTVRIEPHVKGNVFTMDRVEADGRAISYSSILYFDNTPRDFQDFECSGTQSSRWVENEKAEIRRVCAASDWTWLLRQSAQNSQELTVAITGKLHSGQSYEWHIVLKKK